MLAASLVAFSYGVAVSIKRCLTLSSRATRNVREARLPLPLIACASSMMTESGCSRLIAPTSRSPSSTHSSSSLPD